jgi:hypothetical protein
MSDVCLAYLLLQEPAGQPASLLACLLFGLTAFQLACSCKSLSAFILWQLKSFRVNACLLLKEPTSQPFSLLAYLSAQPACLPTLTSLLASLL